MPAWTCALCRGLDVPHESTPARSEIKTNFVFPRSASKIPSLRVTPTPANDRCRPRDPRAKQLGGRSTFKRIVSQPRWRAHRRNPSAAQRCEHLASATGWCLSLACLQHPESVVLATWTVSGEMTEGGQINQQFISRTRSARRSAIRTDSMHMCNCRCNGRCPGQRDGDGPRRAPSSW